MSTARCAWLAAAWARSAANDTPASAVRSAWTAVCCASRVVRLAELAVRRAVRRVVCVRAVVVFRFRVAAALRPAARRCCGVWLFAALRALLRRFWAAWLVLLRPLLLVLLRPV